MIGAEHFLWLQPYEDKTSALWGQTSTLCVKPHNNPTKSTEKFLATSACAAAGHAAVAGAAAGHDGSAGGAGG